MNMTRDGKRQAFITRRTSSKRQCRCVIAALSLLIVAGVIGGLAYKKTFSIESIAASVSAFMQRVAGMRPKAQVPALLAKVKHIVNHPNELPPPIHFEFYTALADAKVSPSAVEARAQVSSQQGVLPPSSKSQDLSSTIFSHEVLERDLHDSVSDHKEIARYYIQLGTFEEASGAARLRVALLDAGFTTQVIKISSGQRIMYRVQLGPYVSQSQVRTMQQRMQKRGITSVIYKEWGAVNNAQDEA